MKIKLYIVCIVYLIISCTNFDLKAQTAYTLCSGSKNVTYQVTENPGSIYHWSVEGGQIISDPHGHAIVVNWDHNLGEYTVTVFEETKTGCRGNNLQIKILILPSPAMDIGKLISICEGENVALNPGIGFNSYVWQDGSTGSTLLADHSGIYWVEVTNENGCSFRDSVKVTVNPLPVIHLGEDNALCAPDEIMLDAGDFEGYYNWYNGSTSRTLIAKEGDGKIWVNVTDENGCMGSDTIQILKCLIQKQIELPNVFTPNGDGHNDFWEIGGWQNFPDISVKIYDRWGIQVFNSEHGYAIPWDGTSSGKQLPMDAYYYLINLGDGSKEITGSITLIR